MRVMTYSLDHLALYVEIDKHHCLNIRAEGEIRQDTSATEEHCIPITVLVIDRTTLISRLTQAAHHDAGQYHGELAWFSHCVGDWNNLVG